MRRTKAKITMWRRQHQADRRRAKQWRRGGQADQRALHVMKCDEAPVPPEDEVDAADCAAGAEE